MKRERLACIEQLKGQVDAAKEAWERGRELAELLLRLRRLTELAEFGPEDLAERFPAWVGAVDGATIGGLQIWRRVDEALREYSSDLERVAFMRGYDIDGESWVDAWVAIATFRGEDASANANGPGHSEPVALEAIGVTPANFWRSRRRRRSKNS